MLRDVSSKLINAIIVVDASRWTRDSAKNADAIAHLQKHGARFFDVTREYILDNEEDLFILGVFSAMHRYVAGLYVKKGKLTRLERARRGWPHSDSLPYGRVLKNNDANRQATDAIWALDPNKYQLARKMYNLYIEEALTWGQVGKAMSMNPETVRRILQLHSGSKWIRHFNDPTTNSFVEVQTEIPSLLTEEEISRVKERAKNNQMTREGWTERKRQYPLANYVRCSNPDCGWSSLSGHQTLNKGKEYAYYIHLPRNRHNTNCISSIPAELLESEILSRLGDFISNSKELESAIHSALATSEHDRESLLTAQDKITQDIAKKQRAIDRLVKDMALNLEDNVEVAESIRKATAEFAGEIGNAKKQLIQIQQQLKIIKIPSDLKSKIATVRHLFKSWNGKMAMHWPPEAQRLLVQLFFGSSCPRFDRESVGIKANTRGIFVRKVKGEMGEYWVYEAKGLLGSIGGALTGFPALYDRHYAEQWNERPTEANLGGIVRSLDSGAGSLQFRVSQRASTHWSA